MERFKEILKIKIEDETAAFAILGVMVITFAILIGTFELIQYNRVAEVSSNNPISLGEQPEETNVENLTGLANVLEEETNVIDEEKLKEENEKEYEKLKEENKVSSAADKYYIKVNYGAQVVNIYKRNSNGEYEPYKAMLCSTGTYTPTGGVYRTLAKGNWWPLYGDVYGQYSTHIYDGILFHSVPYLRSGDKSSLEYWAYDQLGQRVSMGCVRLTTIDAKWIYDNCPVGTQVEFYSSSNPGPFGKPTAMKISNAPANIRGWDPTDPDSRNPWPKYLKELEESEKEDTNTTKPDDMVNNVNELINDVSENVVNEVTGGNVNDVANEVVNEVDGGNVEMPEGDYNAINEVTVNDTLNSLTPPSIIPDSNETDVNDINSIADNVYVSEIASGM